ncbi:hypothetical protein JK628_20415 [Shewanella sp. KX20019]|nr:hypothetical protein [Shewanella sp. KX20019]QQX82676.1 hypothetical protein JK628_20415 [Shewanella sp. KX20019]
MELNHQNLPTDLVELQLLVLKLQQELHAKDVKINFLEEQFRLAQQKQFGKSAEGHIGEGEVFNEA